MTKITCVAVALATCTACTAGTSVAPPSGELPGQYTHGITQLNGRLVTAARVRMNAPRYVTFSPAAPAKSNGKDFEYVINDYGSYASIFNYPKDVEQIGKIKNVGGQGCTNVLYGYGKQTFWIVAGQDNITEYQVPKKPIKTLSVPYEAPSSCAMNTNGDLAVGNLTNGGIVFFKHATGSGKFMKTPLAYEFFDGYDNQGNLFADGFASNHAFMLVELPKGTNTFQTITTSNDVMFPGSVQWDGKYLTVDDQEAASIYRYAIDGTQAVLKGTVSLSGSLDCAQTWIATGVVYCADSFSDDGAVYKYPAGGAAIAVFTGHFDEPLGTVAVARNP